MAFGRNKPSPDDSSPGLKQELTSFFKDASSYAQIRGELLAIEAKEAAGSYGKKVALVVVGGVLLFVGHLILVAGLAGIIGTALAGQSVSLTNWSGACLILAGLHFVIGFLLLSKGRKTGSDTPMFEYSRNEFKKDQEWLSNQKKS